MRTLHYMPPSGYQKHVGFPLEHKEHALTRRSPRVRGRLEFCRHRPETEKHLTRLPHRRTQPHLSESMSMLTQRGPRRTVLKSASPSDNALMIARRASSSGVLCDGEGSGSGCRMANVTEAARAD